MELEISKEYTSDEIFDIQREFNARVAKYFIRNSAPLQSVDQSCFRDMFSFWNIEKFGITVMSETELNNYIIESNILELHLFRYATKYVDEVSLTAIYYWKNFKTPLLITVCNWITKGFNRKSYLLDCSRFTGNVNSKWDRIVHAVKDFDEEVLKKLLLDKEKHSRDINKVLKEGGIVTLSGLKSDLKISLNICPGIELIEFCNSARREFADTFGKCDALWHRTDDPSLSTVIKDAINDSCICLDRPQVDFGEPLHKALQQILKIKDKATKLYDALKLENRLEEKDFSIIKEYLKLFKPVSEAIEKLKNDKDRFYGIVLPCLLTLRKKLIHIANEDNTFIYYKPNEYLNTYQIEFAEYFNLSSDNAMNAAIAAISYPKFKNKWFGCIDVKLQDRIIGAFRETISKAVSAEITREVDTEDEEQEKNDDFFEFESYDVDATRNSSKVHNGYTIEYSIGLLNCYLNDQETDLTMLYRHHTVARVFRKYNTPMSINAAACEPEFHRVLHELASVTQDEDMLSARLSAKYNRIM